MKRLAAIIAALVLLGCSQKDTHQEDTASDKAAAVAQTDSWLGEWRGVEGLHVSIDRDSTKGAGHYVLVMRFGLDDKDSGIFNGQATGNTLTFTRAGKEVVLRHTDGQATGLKWLAGKTDCITVAEGEGYCQD